MFTGLGGQRIGFASHLLSCPLALSSSDCPIIRQQQEQQSAVMARSAVFFAFVAACVVLVLAYQAEIVNAQNCPAVDVTKFAACVTDVQRNTCGAQCKSDLDQYASLSDACICSFVDKAKSFYRPAQIKSLLQKCYPGRTLPCL
ncbi:hypothetical protein Mp_3g18190 [Marchantia polymorpha subsp. ruderalis]|uniref:Uncharacterized protein n=2 Tax=Marchantia polymorpha TaxID=3197 RepID=A0AAF6B245_MARPO|nr:hypothetical protein MARPO_0140s0022 [Marchantia polymorpha]BBN06079.1 hypothetical protein Mp_3g18190 [Marchantia polymorpha subsp. ruderalis]|eukprot:PTQ29488.1 hypothetical protein MARPO_0140s0022 [Marchantia polymorpha]